MRTKNGVSCTYADRQKEEKRNGRTDGWMDGWMEE